MARQLLPASGDLEQFVAAIAHHRNRPIRIWACELAADEPSGLWVPLPDEDLVLHAGGIPAEHRTVIVCHEVAHMLLEHRSPVGEADLAIIGAALGLSIDQ